MCLFKKCTRSKYNKFALSGHMSLRIIAELLKNAPVLVKRLEWYLFILAHYTNTITFTW